MTDIAIRVDNLGKRYRIGGPQARYKTLRESIVGAVTAPLRRLRAAGRDQETIWALKERGLRDEDLLERIAVDPKVMVSKIGPAKWRSVGGRNEMRIRYDSESDVLLFVLRDLPPVDAVEEAGGVIISYGENGEAVSVEFLHASARRLIQTGEISLTLQAERVPERVYAAAEL